MEKQRWEESEKRREEERRSEKRKNEKKEDAGGRKGIKVAIHCVCPSKTKQFCEASFKKLRVECRADGLAPMRFAIFPFHLSKVLRLPRISEARSQEVLHLSRKIILGKPEDLMLQNATPLRKSVPGPPNISDKHVSCTAPATRKTSCEILCKRPSPAIVLGHATKPSPFAHFWQGA